jgi:transposase
VDDRRTISGVFYIVRAGAPWRDSTECYGHLATVCNHYNRWAKAGDRLRIFEALVKNSQPCLHLIDRSIVRAHQLGRPRQHQHINWYSNRGMI